MTGAEAILASVGVLLLLAALFLAPVGAMAVGLFGFALTALGVGLCLYDLSRQVKKTSQNVREEE